MRTSKNSLIAGMQIFCLKFWRKVINDSGNLLRTKLNIKDRGLSFQPWRNLKVPRRSVSLFPFASTICPSWLKAFGFELPLQKEKRFSPFRDTKKGIFFSF